MGSHQKVRHGHVVNKVGGFSPASIPSTHLPASSSPNIIGGIASENVHFCSICLVFIDFVLFSLNGGVFHGLQQDTHDGLTTRCDC